MNRLGVLASSCALVVVSAAGCAPRTEPVSVAKAVPGTAGFGVEVHYDDVAGEQQSTGSVAIAAQHAQDHSDRIWQVVDGGRALRYCQGAAGPSRCLRARFTGDAPDGRIAIAACPTCSAHGQGGSPVPPADAVWAIGGSAVNTLYYCAVSRGPVCVAVQADGVALRPTEILGAMVVELGPSQHQAVLWAVRGDREILRCAGPTDARDPLDVSCAVARLSGS